MTEAATPLEAIYCLDEAKPPELMQIADTSPPSIGEELQAYVLAEHCDVKVIRWTARERT